MKILHVDVLFLLPDDFEGTRSDALRLLAQYDEETEDKLHKAQAHPDETEVGRQLMALRWGWFVNMIRDTSLRVRGTISVQRRKDKDTPWEDIA